MGNEPNPGPPGAATRTISGTRPRRIARPEPIGGVDYPRNARELGERFGDESSCLRVLERLRWPGGYACRKCGHRGAPFRSGRVYGCPACGYLASIAFGTLFHGTAKPLRLWLAALWEIADPCACVHAQSVRRLLGLRSDQEAAEWLVRLQRAMAVAARRPLRGSVEVAAIYVSTRCDAARRAGATRPAVVAIAAERSASPLGRVRLRVLWPVASITMLELLVAAVAPRSVVYTGPWAGYAPIAHAGFVHVAPPPGQSQPATQPALPHVERAADRLRRWLWHTRNVTR
ncbi:MAG: IS1595 family transposase, partial [Deltaproteobacteria bacterium]|nr:IS1595 family transposase [Deltaproteobacteria bacterium]MBW2537826.1 IS1595 family transposase [Deltaproteobacteria bacterium]